MEWWSGGTKGTNGTNRSAKRRETRPGVQRVGAGADRVLGLAGGLGGVVALQYFLFDAAGRFGRGDGVAAAQRTRVSAAGGEDRKEREERRERRERGER